MNQTWQSIDTEGDEGIEETVFFKTKRHESIEHIRKTDLECS